MTANTSIHTHALVHIVDDEAIVREALATLLEAAGLTTRSYASAESFLRAFDKTIPGCVVIDVCLPGMSGLDVQAQLSRAGATTPIIILTGHADVPMAVEAMARGAVGLLQKPPRSHELLEMVSASVDWHCAYLEQSTRRGDLGDKLKELTDREREILQLVVDGKASKDIAARLGISQRTVEQHRSHLMRKLEVDSVAQLVRMAVELRDSPSPMQMRHSVRAMMPSAVMTR
jgi:FixJ family two-component response regulator